MNIFYQASGRDHLGHQVQRLEQEIDPITGKVTGSTRRMLGRAADAETAAAIAAGLNRSFAFHQMAGSSPQLFEIVERAFFPRAGVAQPSRKALATA